MLSLSKQKNKGDGIYLLMYNVEFYEDTNGVSELWDFLEDLRLKSKTSKDARIQHKQISLYIQLLQDNGTRLPDNITKHLGVKSNVPKQNVTIILLERRHNYENLERIQGTRKSG